MSSVFFRLALLAFCCIACIPDAVFAAEREKVGLVLSLTPGVIATREGQQVALEQKSPVNGTDVLNTDATGRAQILFADDSSVSLGSNTTLVLEDVVAEGKNPVFKARLGQGLARFITGKIVEQNPDGFAVVTPEAVVGIRGTIFAVSTSNGKTTVYVMNTTRQVLVNGITVPGGYKVTLPDGTPLPMTPADLIMVSDAVAAGNGPGSNGGTGTEKLIAWESGKTVFNPDTLEQPELGKQLIGDSLAPGYTSTAYVEGYTMPTTITTPGSLLTAGVGSFSFTADLGSGAVSDASMSNTNYDVGTMGSGISMSYTLTGGSGTINGTTLTVSGLAGTSGMTGVATQTGATGSMNGTAINGTGGLTVNGNYRVDFNNTDLAGVGLTSEDGIFNGQQTPAP
ncbi:MAG: FecR family protein [Deltaproteobacteria bacterium]|jgi:hypothetical protein|nr:FecR family protein [Deltaproteobacteria bacterium]